MGRTVAAAKKRKQAAKQMIEQSGGEGSSVSVSGLEKSRPKLTQLAEANDWADDTGEEIPLSANNEWDIDVLERHATLELPMGRRWFSF